MLIVGFMLYGKEGLYYVKGWYGKLLANIQAGWKEIKKKEVNF